MESLKIQTHEIGKQFFLFWLSTIFFPNKNSLVNYRVYIKFTVKMSKKKKKGKLWHHWMTEVEVTLESMLNPHREAKTSAQTV